ncbi:hypothetical protein, partial [Enterocloster citroniae]
MKKIRDVVIIGMGAMGSGYAWQITKYNKEAKVFGIVRDSQRYREQPIMVNDQKLPVECYSFEEL